MVCVPCLFLTSHWKFKKSVISIWFPLSTHVQWDLRLLCPCPKTTNKTTKESVFNANTQGSLLTSLSLVWSPILWHRPKVRGESLQIKKQKQPQTGSYMHWTFEIRSGEYGARWSLKSLVQNPAYCPVFWSAVYGVCSCCAAKAHSVVFFWNWVQSPVTR